MHMSLKTQSLEPIPEETARVARLAFPKGTVAMKLRDAFQQLYQDESFQTLYSRRGPPAFSPWRLALVTVLQFMENLSDRQAADAVRGRIDWKYALALELTDPGFHFSVLSEFRGRLVGSSAQTLLLDLMLERFRGEKLLKARGKQRTDSTHVLAAVREIHLTELIAETLRAALNDLATVAPDWLRDVAPPAWFERYSWRIEEKHLPHASPARTTYVVQVGEDGFALLDAIQTHDTGDSIQILWERPAVQILRQVWAHHFERQASACRWKEPGEWLPTGERVHSPYDPEAHFSDKRGVKWLGYKVHYTETCDQDDVHLIVDSETCYAEIPDVASTHAIQQKLAKKELCPQEHLVDAGYTDAELLVTSQQQQITLIGPMRVNSSWQAKAGQGYDLPHFPIDWDRQRATCPEGKSSTKWRPGKDAFGNEIIQLQFSRSDCSPCAARSLCTRAKSSPRHIVLHPKEQHEALLQAREEAQSTTWLARYHVRAGIEGTLSQGIRAFGLRRTRYMGLAKTALQHANVAAAINVVRVTAWLAGTPRITTRTSRFASLRPTA